MTGQRFCPCGTRLARDNPGRLCSPCYRKSAETETFLSDEGRAWLDEVRLVAQAAASVYSRPTDFASAGHYLAALSDPLDRLCRIFEIAPPRFEGQSFEQTQEIRIWQGPEGSAERRRPHEGSQNSARLNRASGEGGSGRSGKFGSDEAFPDALCGPRLISDSGHASSLETSDPTNEEVSA